MYAHAYSLSKILNYNLYIDDSSGFSSKKTQLRKHQKYMLNYFNIRQNIASKNNKYDTFYKYHKKKLKK